MPWSSGESLSPSILNLRQGEATLATGYSSNTLQAQSGLTVEFLSDISVQNTIAGQRVELGGAPSSASALASLRANSALTDYFFLQDSSGAKHNFLIGLRTGDSAASLVDGLNLYDTSANTMIVRFSSDSVRFYPPIVAPLFDTGGALSDTYNAALFLRGSSKESQIQAAITAAAADGISRVYVPASLYPYSAASVSFDSRVQMVREGGNWTNYDVQAYGAAGDNAQDDTPAVQAAVTNASATSGSVVFFPAGTYKISSAISPFKNSIWEGSGAASQLLASGAGVSLLSYRVGTVGQNTQIPGEGNVRFSDLFFNGTTSSGNLLQFARITYAYFDHCIFNNSTGTGLNDASSSVSAAGISLYAVEISDIRDCRFENNHVGLVDEVGCHMQTLQSNQFNNNGKAHVWIPNNDNGVLSLIGNNFFGGGCALRSDVGSLYDLALIGNWAEQQLGNTSILSCAGSARNYNWFLTANHFASNSSSLQTAIAVANVDQFICQANSFVGFQRAFSTTASIGSSNVYGPNSYSSVTQLFAADSLAAAGALASWESSGLSLGNVAFRVGYRNAGGTALAPSSAYSSEASLGWYRSGTSTIAQSYGTLLVAPNSADKFGVGTLSPSFKITNNYVASPQTFTNATNDFIEMWQANGTNALGISLQTGATTAFFAVNNGYDLAFSIAATDRLRVKNTDGRVYMSAGLALPDGTLAAPGSAFSSELSLGLYRSGTSTIAMSYGTLNLNQVRLVSIRTQGSLDSTTLAQGELAIAIAVASGASMALRSGNTIYYWTSSASTKG